MADGMESEADGEIEVSLIEARTARNYDDVVYCISSTIGSTSSKTWN